jgi:alpha-L-rhamnosidase
MKLLSSILLLFFAFFSCNRSGQNELHFDRLLCEYTENPNHVFNPNPRFTWVIEASAPGKNQSGYRILVAASAKSLTLQKDLLWDSDKVLSDQTMHIVYAGKTLESNTSYYWKVIIWDEQGISCESPVIRFTTSLLHPTDWQAKWIGANPGNEPIPAKGFFMDRKEESGLSDTVHHQGRSVLLRKNFKVPHKIKTARLFITGLGFYEAEINGVKVGEDVLSPSKTPYHKHIHFDTYDVTSILKKGENAIGIHLGNGWYNPYKKWWKEYRMQWFGHKKALAQLLVNYENGKEEIIYTDETWKTIPGPVLYNCVYDGEVYDAREEISGWSDAGLDDSEWQPVVIMKTPGAQLTGRQMPPIKINEVRKPVKVTEPKPGMLVYDLGQNFTGWVRLKLKGEIGTKITIRHSEELYEDGTLDFTCNERARAAVDYILKGGEQESYEPAFTYFGFQFVEITSDGPIPEIIDLEGCVGYSANEKIGHFSSSYDLINKMHNATVWSQMSNMLSYPMDCPQRDERLGWMGDAQVTAEEAMFNFDMALHYENWFAGIRANQDEETGDIPIISPRPYIKDDGIEWSSSYITMVWQHYLYYGDLKILADNYPAMSRFMDYLSSIAENHILPKGWIGDWGSMVVGWREGEPVSTPTAYYFYNATILKKVANILKINGDADHFEKLAEEIKKAYNREFFDLVTKNYNDGSQMANGFPLYLGLVEGEYLDEVLQNLVMDIVDKNDTHLTTGVLGTKYMIDALSLHGRSDIAWALATQTTYPSWAEMMKRFNTMCEFWTLKQSHNHVMMGSIDAWFYKVLAGIQLEEKNPGFYHINIKPFVAEGLHEVRASTRTFRGEVSSEWSKTDDGMILAVKIPFNTTGTVFIPGRAEDGLLVNGLLPDEMTGVKYLTYDGGHHVCEVSSGSWEFILRK